MAREMSVFIIATVFSITSCAYAPEELFGRDDEVASRARTMREIMPPQLLDEDRYTIAVITDVHFARESRSGEAHNISCDKFVSYLNGLEVRARPRFVICLGDVTEYGKKSGVEEYCAWVKTLEEIETGDGSPRAHIAVYNAVGNHDLYNSGYDVWSAYVSPYTFYHFSAGHLSWYFIDSASGALGRRQYTELSDAMEHDDGYKVVLSHFPLYAGGKFYFCMQDTTERNMLLSLFAKHKVIAAFTGHTHECHTDNFGNFTEYNIPSLLDKGQWAIVEVSAPQSGTRPAIKVRIMGGTPMSAFAPLQNLRALER